MNESRSEHFAKMIRNTMDTPAWRALSSTAQALYPWLKLEWQGAKFNNNGKLRLSVRQAAERLGCSTNAATRAFQDLQAKGFVVVREVGCLGTQGQGKSHAYEITEIEMPQDRSGRRLYLTWSEGNDFPVKKAASANPAGASRKAEPHRNNEDSPVADLATFRKGLSSK